MHEDFELLRDSWLLTLDSDGYSGATIASYGSPCSRLSASRDGTSPVRRNA